MKLDDPKDKRELVGGAMLALSVLLAVLIAAKVTGYFLAPANAADAVKQAIEQSKPDDKNVMAQGDKSSRVANALKRQNLFSPPPTRRNPVTAVTGIFGDEALINGKWYKAGTKVADAKIVAVDATSVTVDWDGQRRVFNPIDGGSSSDSGGPSRPGRSTVVSRRTDAAGVGGPKMVVTESVADARPRKEPSALAMKMKGAFESMSPAQRDKFARAMEKSAEQYKKMSGDEKTKFKAAMIVKIGSGGRITFELKSK